MSVVFIRPLLITATAAVVTILVMAPLRAAPAVSPDRLVVVDCLLPGQVRKLGGQMTYLSPRRPVKATASECEIRGGEYVSFDRANYATALQVWLPQANDGDPQAQTYVGEIYEKGLGLPPDHAKAAEWYRKAADKGYTRALSNLAYLYEKGLGVQQDPVMALNLYRKSAGLTEDELTFASEVQAVQSQLDETVAKLEAQTQQAERLRGELGTTKKQLSTQLESLALSHKQVDQLKQELTAARGNSDPQRVAQVKKLEAELAAREARIRQQQDEVAALEKSASARQGELEKQLAAASTQDAALRKQLGEQSAETASVRAQLAAAEERVRGTEQRVQDLTTQLETERETIARERVQLAKSGASKEIEQLKQRVKEREALLSQQNKLISTLQQQKKTYESEIGRLRTQLLAQERQGKQQTQEIQNVRAQLASAEQRLLQTQQQVAQATATLESERALVAKEREELNKRTAAATAEQLKEAQRLASQLATRETQIVEQRARIASLEVEQREYEEQIRSLRAAPANQVVATRDTDTVGVTPVAVQKLGRFKLPRELEVGTYHALIIGNNKYQYMPSLDSAVNDAQAIDRVLRTRYGFKTRVLINATRGEILSALNEYRVSLKDRDNLLIYYAGHGELDSKNLRGYWLPINARREETTEWISDSMITDQIGLMAAKHVLVVADSCYSGVMTRSAGVRLVGDGTDNAEVKRLVKLAKLPSRTVLTSGGEQPVLDGGSGGPNSIFAAVFLDVLTRNEGVLEGSRLYNALFDPVRSAAARFNIEQSPRYSMLADAGHLNGEFLFVPNST